MNGWICQPPPRQIMIYEIWLFQLFIRFRFLSWANRRSVVYPLKMSFKAGALFVDLLHHIRNPHATYRFRIDSANGNVQSSHCDATTTWCTMHDVQCLLMFSAKENSFAIYLLLFIHEHLESKRLILIETHSHRSTHLPASYPRSPKKCRGQVLTSSL